MGVARLFGQLTSEAMPHFLPPPTLGYTRSRFRHTVRRPGQIVCPNSLAPHVADVSATCRRHRQMSPNLGRHCVSLRHRRVPDTPNFPQLQPTSTSQSKRTSTLAIIAILRLNSNNNQEIADMSGIPRHVGKCRFV